jgi:hypothetical protein
MHKLFIMTFHFLDGIPRCCWMTAQCGPEWDLRMSQPTNNAVISGLNQTETHDASWDQPRRHGGTEETGGLGMR